VEGHVFGKRTNKMLQIRVSYFVATSNAPPRQIPLLKLKDGLGLHQKEKKSRFTGAVSSRKYQPK